MKGAITKRIFLQFLYRGVLVVMLTIAICGCKSQGDDLASTQSTSELAMSYSTTTEAATKAERMTAYASRRESKEAVTETESVKSDETPVVSSRLDLLFHFGNVKTGDYITFGSYEQDNNFSNGPEDIEWLVLDKQEDKMLVISRYGLDCQLYNTGYEEVTWETSSLRNWLNNSFYERAFSDGERSMILESVVTADANPREETPAGNDTKDKVFLLSINEAKRYFVTDVRRKCRGTYYCYAQGALETTNGCCFWWLRSPGSYSNFAAYVNYQGHSESFGNPVIEHEFAVRPALWITIAPLDGLHENETEPLEISSRSIPSISELSSLNVGSSFFFGEYEQDNVASNGKEAIEWLVLDKQEDKMLVISRYGLDIQHYNYEFASVTWETCSLRSWLNSTFYNVFTPEEKSAILTSTIIAEPNSAYDTPAGNDTTDKVFLLSIDEANRYFPDYDAKLCQATPYCYAQVSDSIVSKNRHCWWWLRSPGRVSDYAAYVFFGDIAYEGQGVSGEKNAVRPAMWIDLNGSSAVTETVSKPSDVPAQSGDEQPITKTPLEDKQGTLQAPDNGVLRSASIGSYITFGKYEQNNDFSNGPEDIEWLVLDKQEDRMLVISRYGLDCQPYNSEFKEVVTWETCTLRNWLNSTFYEAAFILEEKSAILSSIVTADANPKYDTPAGNDTTDKVFLLSVDEAFRYFDDYASRVCQGTPYSKAQGVYLQEGNCIWWLRSPGIESCDAAYIYYRGGVNNDIVHCSWYAVRPAMWIDLKP